MKKPFNYKDCICFLFLSNAFLKHWFAHSQTLGGGEKGQENSLIPAKTLLLSFIGFEFLFGHQDWCCQEQHICIQVKIYSDILMNIYSRGEGLPSDTIQKEAARRASRVGEKVQDPPKKNFNLHLWNINEKSLDPLW